MFTKVSSFALSVLMYVVLYGTQSNLYLLAAGVFGLILATVAINFKRLNFTWPHLLLPVIYIISVASVYSLVTNVFWQETFLVVAALVFFLMEIRLGRESHLLQNIFLLSAFGIFLGLFAVDYYFQLPTYVFVPLVFAAGFILSVQGFTGFQLPAKKYFYFLSALITAQVAWGLSFWPTYYFVNGVVLFCVFYIIWLFSFSAFFGKLSRAKIFWQLSLMTLILLIVLSTASWSPLS